MKYLLTMLLILFGMTTNALAVDPAWYTVLTTELTWLTTAVVGVLGTVITIRLAPLAWVHIKRVLYR